MIDRHPRSGRRGMTSLAELKGKVVNYGIYCALGWCTAIECLVIAGLQLSISPRIHSHPSPIITFNTRVPVPRLHGAPENISRQLREQIGISRQPSTTLRPRTCHAAALVFCNTTADGCNHGDYDDDTARDDRAMDKPSIETNEKA